MTVFEIQITKVHNDTLLLDVHKRFLNYAKECQDPWCRLWWKGKDRG